MTPTGQIVSGVPMVWCDFPFDCRSVGLPGVAVGTPISPGTISTATSGGTPTTSTLVEATTRSGGVAPNVAVRSPTGAIVYGVLAADACDAYGNCAQGIATGGSQPASRALRARDTGSAARAGKTAHADASRTCDAKGNCRPSAAAKRSAHKSVATKPSARTAAAKKKVVAKKPSTARTTTAARPVAPAQLATHPPSGDCDYLGRCASAMSRDASARTRGADGSS